MRDSNAPPVAAATQPSQRRMLDCHVSAAPPLAEWVPAGSAVVKRTGERTVAWRELQPSEFDRWNERLLEEPTASIRQFPLFNEGLRNSGRLWVATPGRRYAGLIAAGRRWTTKPRYLVNESADGRLTFASLVTIGIPGLQVGCILDGPVTFDGHPVEPAAIRQLAQWARRRGYIAIRVTHSKESFLESLATMVPAERVDGVPFYPLPISELYVNLSGGEAAIQAGFQAVARRNIRQATDAGYTITVDRDPQALKKAWSAFESRSAQKGISYRNLETYMRMMRHAEPHQAAHLYTAWRQDTPIAAILVLRDCTTAHYFLGTIDTEALGDAPSPAVLLQWSAMRDAAKSGAAFYNLGTRSGPVYTFKSKFRPVEHVHPEPVTIVVNPALYKLWRRLLPSMASVAV